VQSEAVDADGDVGQRDVVEGQTVVKLVAPASYELVDVTSYLLRLSYRVRRTVNTAL